VLPKSTARREPARPWGCSRCDPAVEGSLAPTDVPRRGIQAGRDVWGAAPSLAAPSHLCPCFMPDLEDLPPVSGRGRGSLLQGEGLGLLSSCLLNSAAKCFHVGSGCCPPQLPSPPRGRAQPGWAAPHPHAARRDTGVGISLSPMGLAGLQGGGRAAVCVPNLQPGVGRAVYLSGITALR